MVLILLHFCNLEGYRFGDIMTSLNRDRPRISLEWLLSKSVWKNPFQSFYLFPFLWFKQWSWWRFYQALYSEWSFCNHCFPEKGKEINHFRSGDASRLTLQLFIDSWFPSETSRWLLHCYYYKTEGFSLTVLDVQKFLYEAHGRHKNCSHPFSR